MVRVCRILFLIALICAGAALPAAVASEAGAFNKAAKKFQAEAWDFAAADFAAFVTNYPASIRIPEAILYQGEALIKSRRFNAGIELLSAHQKLAAEWGDQYLYWIAQAHLGNSNFVAAAQTFARLLQDFPGSGNRLDACVSQAGAYASIGDWERVVEVLDNPDSVFRQLAANTSGDLIPRGYLMLGEAQLARKNFPAANAALRALSVLSLNPEFAWRRLYLECRIQLGEGNSDGALSNATNLVALASITGNSRFQAESHSFEAKTLEQLQRYDQAVAALEKNLVVKMPVDQQRAALLKIARISMAQNKFSEAVRKLENYWNQYPQSEAADTVLLTLGELQLRQFVATGRNGDAGTNLLSDALGRFDLLLKTFPNSPLVGKALLCKGWCLWSDKEFSSSEEAFQAAADRLPFSEDQAVARFKLADAQFKAGKFDAAVGNYRLLVASNASIPEVKDKLLEQALYQWVRAAIAATNLPAAEEGMRKVLDWYPDGFAGDRCLLLVAEGYAQDNEPAKARQLLSEFEAIFPSSTLLPQVRLAIARTYEKERDWPAAITNYEAWAAVFTTNSELPKAQFSLAWDTARAGLETNALVLFTNFVARFPSNELAPRAQWWIGDYYLSHGDSSKAEESYQFPKAWSWSELYLPAQMMAGRAAMARVLGYKDAIAYFTNLVANPACPIDLKVQAAFAAGDAYMSRTEAGATNRAPDLEEALTWFKSILSTNEQAILAWGRMGDCYQELGKYKDAAEQYHKVMGSPLTTAPVRRQAMIGLGLIAERKAAGAKSPDEKKTFLTDALRIYMDAFFEREQRAGEQPDLFWLPKAGVEAARLAESLGEWSQAINVYRELLALQGLPAQTRAYVEKRLAKATEQSRAAGVIN